MALKDGKEEELNPVDFGLSKGARLNIRSDLTEGGKKYHLWYSKETKKGDKIAWIRCTNLDVKNDNPLCAFLDEEGNMNKNIEAITKKYMLATSTRSMLI